jgi:glyoxylase-like metal-dependent hydrolase (beta-lactamase superfamily II)
MQVVPGIEYVDDTAPAHVYVLDDGQSITLIDAGLPDEAPKVLSYLERTGRTPEQVTRIVLTHRHGDHAGAAAELVARTKATVYAHADEIAPLTQGGTSIAAVEPLEDGDVLPVFEGLQAIAVPGHTAGHLCFYLPRRKVLFTGDAILNRGGVSGPVPQYTSDVPMAHASLREKIAPLEVDTLCVSHGDPIVTGAAEPLRAAIASLS